MQQLFLHYQKFVVPLLSKQQKQQKVTTKWQIQKNP
nr:MAG TPA: hypothetical protein [Caudoviricetes sp.]